MQRSTLNAQRSTFKWLLPLLAACCLLPAISSAQTTQPIDAADAAAVAAVGQLYQAGQAAISAANAAAADAVVARQQLAALSNANATLKAQLSTLNIQVNHDGAGKATSFAAPAGSTLLGQNFFGAKFNAPQQYACVLGDGCTVAGGTFTSDSGGLTVRGNNCVVVGVVAKGCGQNGISGGLANSGWIINCTSSGNNILNYNAYNEGGGGKISKCSNLTFINCNYSGNFGVGWWADVSCSNIAIIGGTFIGNTVAGANAGKQVEAIRWEISSGLSIKGATIAAGPSQNTAIGICDADTVSIAGNTITGQIGIEKTAARAATNPTKNISITGNTIVGNIYWFSGIQGLILDGNTYKLHAGQPLAYIDGKPIATLAAMQAMGFELHGKVIYQ